MVKLIFFGTSAPAATVLSALASANNLEVVAVVTQPGKPKGRKHEIQASPVKKAASLLHLPVFEPLTLNDFDFKTIPPCDVFFIFAYGLILPEALLSSPPHGSLNLHPSLLPKYRGPSPIQSALLNGETQTGVSIIQVDAQMDHGPILKQISTEILPTDTTESLTDRLVAEAISFLPELIVDWCVDKIKPETQNHTTATFTKFFDKTSGQVNWDNSTATIYNQYRACTPWPGIWTTSNGKRLKLISVTPSELKGDPGKIFVTDHKLYIGCSVGSLEVSELQLEGGLPLTAKEFLSGHQNFVGVTLI